MVLWAIAAIPLTSLGLRPPQTSTRRTATTLDPNDARWWELATLPRIGEELARQITKATSPVGRATDSALEFHSPRDLQRVRGIGPKTAARIAPFLHFRTYSPTWNDGQGTDDTRRD